jgi:hypothetical protein
MPSLHDYQMSLAAHLRNPRAPVPRGCDRQRVNLYAGLLFNNVESYLLACFPVTREILGARRWKRLARGFFALHRAHTPYFHRIPEEFLRHLQTGRPAEPTDPPFLTELAHFEWVELALSTREDPPFAIRTDPHADLLSNRPLLNPTLMVLTYDYPVHRIGRRFQPDLPGNSPTRLLACRNAAHEVHFHETEAATLALVQALKDGTLTGREAIQRVTRELNLTGPHTSEYAAQALRELQRLEIISGVALA